MKRTDFLFLLYFVLLFLPFIVIPGLRDFYTRFNAEHPVLISFIKFSLLATTGELIGLRIKTGSYFKEGFGLLPRALIWGFLGVTVKIAFTVFATGTPVFLEMAGLDGAREIIHGPLSAQKIFVSFCISTALNLFYAPVLMTFHKITDTHIQQHNGSFSCLFKSIRIREIIVNMDWAVQWNFVLKKTIPLFWIPAQTITFLLPAEVQILFAALLGVLLGVLLAVAAIMGNNNQS
ncbi:MAG: hypothetical protein U0T82_02590 [Bacteroidales bacterium]